MVKYCKCGCGTVIPEKNTWVQGHNTRVNNPMHKSENVKKMAESLKGFKHSDETKKKISKLTKEHWEDPLLRRKMSDSHKGLKCSDETKEKMSKAHKGLQHSDITKEKISKAHEGSQYSDAAKEKMSESQKKLYSEMDDPRQQICLHHYIYDFNDLTKYTILVTRSEHMTIHNNLRHAGLEVSCINIMKYEHGDK